ncbi:FAD-dependent oxidoreductase domain-containing protein 1, partial [Asbolus verrucosus]
EPDVNNMEKQRALMGLFPRHADIVIIGGGAIGSSIAYWLKEKTSREGIRVIVIEKDMTYSKCSTRLSMGGLSQQFSLPENIQMSLYGAEFLRTLKKRFGHGADVHFTPQGYLVLADEERAQKLIDNNMLQRELGAVNRILTRNQLKSRFPWLNTTDIELGSLGLEREGWFDPWALLTVLRAGAVDLGTQYINGEVVDFTFQLREDFVVEGIEEGSYEALQEVVQLVLNLLNWQSLQKLENRYVCRFECTETPPGINVPMTVDCSGVYFRRDGLGGSFIGGLSPLENSEIAADIYTHQEILPILENRVPAFKSLKIKNSWHGTYENNSFDDNGIVGPHPYYHNLYLATGFSGHGIQQAPAVGRAVAELILDGDFKTIDLTRFGFDRFIVNKP